MLRVVPFTVFGLVLAACGGTQTGAVGSGVRPDAPTGKQAVDGLTAPCREVGKSGQPLVLDWPAHERQNLEEAMLQGVAVVAYDCKKLRLLSECRADGQYGFLGLSKREEVVQLVDADEIQANLPGFGVKLVANIGAELQRGASLDLAMVLAGKTKTTVPSLDRASLSGSCEGATHFVRGAHIGAFAMTTGTRGTVRTSAQIFGSGVAALSDSQRRAESRDGEPASCAAVQPGDAKAPTGCRSAIRLELAALSEGAAPKSGPSAIDELREASACPGGLVRSGGKCTAPVPERPYQCSGQDADECAQQCDAGSLGSCFALGVMHENGQGAPRDYVRAAELYRRTCDQGSAHGCNRLGVMHFYGGGAEKNAKKAVELFLASCRAGLADACNNLGFVLDVGRGVPRDSQKAAHLFEAACNGGDVPGCFNAGVAHSSGRGVAANAKLAANFFERARQGGVVERFRFGCQHGNAYSCFGLGYLLRAGLFVSKDEAGAKAHFERSCPDIELSCEALGRPAGGNP
ncbi:MAG TPA: tetratricopeptide repeat protein [Polyangiaceae bacterium]|nr:tetratricopeptide repeat protein [Polyangiaceae bacterium]